MNEITPGLFEMAPDAQHMAALDVETIQEAIKAIGLSNTKASNLHRAANMLMDLHGGEVPKSFVELEALPGVGHKTASVVMAQVFGVPSFPVDTHIHRLAQRWGLTGGKNVEQTEKDLKALFPESLWNDLHLQIIFFGREHCAAQRHDPTVCPICSWAAVPPYDQPGASPLKPGQKRPDALGGAAQQKSSPGRAAKKKTTESATPPPSAKRSSTTKAAAVGAAKKGRGAAADAGAGAGAGGGPGRGRKGASSGGISSTRDEGSLAPSSGEGRAEDASGNDEGGSIGTRTRRRRAS